jgi:hypothetical protein
VRVILYITASVTVSSNFTFNYKINILVGSLSLIKEITGAYIRRVYKKSFLSITETGLYFNLLALSVFSWYIPLQN